MSLTSEMSRTTAHIEASRRERLAAIAKISSDLRRQTQKSEASRMDVIATHRIATKSSLRDIFGIVAFTRGSAEELVERFRKERKSAANELWSELDSHVSRIRQAVSAEIAQIAATRATMAGRTRNARLDYLKEMRRRVDAVLNTSHKLMDELSEDRQRAGQVWEQHVSGSAVRQPQTTKRAPAKRASAKRASAAGTVTQQPNRQREAQPVATENSYVPEQRLTEENS